MYAVLTDVGGGILLTLPKSEGTPADQPLRPILHLPCWERRNTDMVFRNLCL